MIRKSILALALTLCLVGFSHGALAATIGAQVDISSISPCPSFCGGGGATFGNASDGGPGVSSAAAVLNDVRGYGEGFAQFSMTDLLPELGAVADAEPNARVGTGSTAYRAFTNAGAATSITLDVSLAGEAASAGATDAVVEAIVAVILGDDLDHSTHAPTLLGEIVPGTEGLEELGVLQLSIDNNAGPQVKMGSITFNVGAGETYFVWANLFARGTRDGVGDSFDTLTMSFVPEPHMLWLLGSGLLALAARRR